MQGEKGKAWLSEYMQAVIDRNTVFRDERDIDLLTEVTLWGDSRWWLERDHGGYRQAPGLAGGNLWGWLFLEHAEEIHSPIRGRKKAGLLAPFSRNPMIPQVLARWTPYQAVTTDLYRLLIEAYQRYWGPYGHVRMNKPLVERQDLPQWQKFAARPVTFLQEAEALNSRLGRPLTVAAAGSNPHGESACGLRHGLTNIPELLQHNHAHRTVEVAGKYILPLYHPDKQPEWRMQLSAEILQRVGRYAVILNGGNQFDFGNAHAFHGRRKNPATPNMDENPANWLLPFPPATHRPETVGFFLQHSLENFGFRCAR